MKHLLALASFGLAVPLPGQLGPTGQPKPAPTVCSVPLLQMTIPKDRNFTMAVIPTPKEGFYLPQAVVPAPPCNEASRTKPNSVQPAPKYFEMPDSPAPPAK